MITGIDATPLFNDSSNCAVVTVVFASERLLHLQPSEHRDGLSPVPEVLTASARMAQHGNVKEDVGLLMKGNIKCKEFYQLWPWSHCLTSLSLCKMRDLLCRWYSYIFRTQKRASLVAQLVNHLPAIQETQFDSWIKKVPWRRDRLPTPVYLDFPGGLDRKELACNVGDLGSIPGLGRSLGRKSWLKTQHSKNEDRSIHPITSWQIDGETMETVTDYFLGLQNHWRWWLQPWN